MRKVLTVAAALIFMASTQMNAIGGCYYQQLTICYMSCSVLGNTCERTRDPQTCDAFIDCGNQCNAAFCWGNGYLPSN